MNIRKRSLTLALLTVFLFSTQAQGSGLDAVFAPFPSRLRAAVKDNLVILSWVDSPDVKAGYIVYRSVNPIDADSLPAATRLDTIAPGIQTYSDSPPDAKTYYYAVLAQAEDGSPYKVFISARNATASGIAIVLPAVVPAAPASAAAQQPALPFVTALAAKIKGDAIVISYKASPKSRLVLYRGGAPIIRAADLLDATLVAAFTDKDGSFADYPVPGVDYYYAILGEEDLKAGKIIIEAGTNSLTAAVQVRSAAVSSGFAETAPSSRTPPLPFFLMEDASSGSAIDSMDAGLPPARSVSPETAKAIAVLLAKAPSLTLEMPATHTLPEELAAPTGGEDYALSLIVSDRMAAKDWAGAADQLRKYLSLNRSPKASARARFYLGEALAFTGAGKDAFFEFLSARDYYPLETKPWIDYVLSTLTNG
jgi:hypothetical protein